MKRLVLISLTCVLALTTICTITLAEKLSPAEILTKVDQIRYPIHSSFQIQCQMYIYDGDQVESRKDMEIYVQNPVEGDSVLVKFVYPVEDYGKAVLSVGDQNWLYFPKTRKTIRVAPQYMLMGGDFSNGDVTKIRLAEDYTATLVGEEEIFEMEAYVLELTANSKSATYRNLKLWVSKEGYLPLKQDIYTITGKLVKSLVYMKFEEMAGSIRPVQMMMTDAIRSTKKTIMVFKSMEVVELPSSMFTKSYLETSN